MSFSLNLYQLYPSIYFREMGAYVLRSDPGDHIPIKFNLKEGR